MVREFCWIAAAPRDREALLSAIAEEEDFSHDADHEDVVVITGHRGLPFAEDLLADIEDHIERAVLLWRTDEGPEVTGQYYDRTDGKFDRKRTVGGASVAAVSDFIAREHDIHGPI